MPRGRKARENRRTGARRNVRRTATARAVAPTADTKARDEGVARPTRAKASGRARTLARLRRGLRPLGILGVLSLVGYGGFLAHRFVVQSPHFRVKHIRVSPTVHVPAAALRRLARVAPGTNIFSVDLAAVARRVERHPWVRAATVRRRLPHTLEIRVVEHRVAGVVLLEDAQTGGALYLVSPDGIVFKRARLEEVAGLPLVTGVRRQDYRRRTAETRAAIREALHVARVYGAKPGRPPLGEVHTDPVEGITLYTARQNVQIRLGRGAPAARLRRLDRVWRELRRRGVRPAVIRLDDARHPNRVAVGRAKSTRLGPT